MRENNRKPIEKCRKKLPQFTTMNVIDGQAGLVSYFSLIFYSLTIDNILNIIVLLILAGVTIATLMGDNGILTKATEAKDEQADATVKEAIALLWNEYQLEIKSSNNEGVKETTKIASTEITRIQGEKANYRTTTATSFLDFLLTEKKVIENDGKIKVEELTGQTLDRGNGTGTADVYIIKETEDSYELTYYDEDSTPQVLWTTAKENEVATKTVDITLDGEPGFTIEYEEGMTWGEWVDSSYNKFGITKEEDDGISYTDDEYRNYDLKGNDWVYSDEEIEDQNYNFVGELPM